MEGYGKSALDKEGGYLPKEDFEYALRYLNAAEEQGNPQEVVRWKASLYALDGQKLKADSLYREALTKDPASISLREDYGGFLMDAEMHSKADYQFRAILQMDEHNANAHKNLGTLHAFHTKDTVRAKYHYQKYLPNAAKGDKERYLVAKELSLLAWQSKNGQKFPTVGKHHLEFDAFEERRQELEKLLAGNSQNPALREELATLYAKRGFHDAALVDLSQIIRTHPERASAYVRKAEIQMALEKPEQAYLTLKEARKQAALSEEVLQNLALMETYYKGDKEATQDLLDEYLERGGRNTTLVRELLQP